MTCVKPQLIALRAGAKTQITVVKSIVLFLFLMPKV